MIDFPSASKTTFMMTSSNGNIFHVTGPAVRNSPVTGEFPHKKASDAEFDIFFDLDLNIRLSKQSRRRWLRRQRVHYDVSLMDYENSHDKIPRGSNKRLKDYKKRVHIPTTQDELGNILHITCLLCKGYPPVSGEFHSHRVSSRELW